VEIDPKYEKIFGYIQDNINKKRPSMDIALKLINLDPMERLKFMNKTKDNSLFKLFILSEERPHRGETFLGSELIIHDRIIDYILENDKIDSEIEDFVLLYGKDRSLIESSSQEQNLQMINGAVNNFILDEINDSQNLFVYVHGPKGVGKKYLVRAYCSRIRKDLIIGDIKMAMESDVCLKEFVKGVIREGILRDGAIGFDNFHILNDVDNKEIAIKDFFKMMEYVLEPIFILSEDKYIQNKYFSENSVIVIPMKRPTYEERKEIWSIYSRLYNIEGLHISELATKFNFTPMEIRDSIKGIKSKFLTSIDRHSAIYKSCYEQVNNKLTEKAIKVNVTYEWNQLILPPEEKKLLIDACNQVKNRYEVYDKWGFGKKVAYGKGLSIICAGPPGTGKTMSAQVMANELNLELYRIDLSQMVSKYVGETEKNLHMIFEEASLSNAILFFDEGDALFGKRSDVKSSNDRYANIQTSYLLQKMEEYEGITMVTTNFLKNIDKAFLRRINFIVNFPFPDSESRKNIWEIMMPDSAPVDEDIDYDFLANTFEVAGGNIKNIIVYGAFLASSERENISMKHIIHAAKYELQKMDKLLLKEDLGEYRYLLDMN
jgi:SpoVK/Ycf46/Vps4 family AAA+-type ATPase